MVSLGVSLVSCRCTRLVRTQSDVLSHLPCVGPVAPYTNLQSASDVHVFALYYWPTWFVWSVLLCGHDIVGAGTASARASRVDERSATTTLAARCPRRTMA